MLDVLYSTKFKKDFKTCQKRNYNMQLLQQIIDTLRIPAPLPIKNKDHILIGNYAGYRECHISPDWLLLYKQNRKSTPYSVKVLGWFFYVSNARRNKPKFSKSLKSN